MTENNVEVVQYALRKKKLNLYNKHKESKLFNIRNII